MSLSSIFTEYFDPVPGMLRPTDMLSISVVAVINMTEPGSPLTGLNAGSFNIVH
jgi:hypothetical protein